MEEWSRPPLDRKEARDRKILSSKFKRFIDIDDYSQDGGPRYSEQRLAHYIKLGTADADSYKLYSNWSSDPPKYLFLVTYLIVTSCFTFFVPFMALYPSPLTWVAFVVLEGGCIALYIKAFRGIS